MLSAKRLMCLSMLAGAWVSVPGALAVTPTSDLWSKFETVQQGTRVLHQEFDVMRHIRAGYVDKVSRFQVILDFSQGKWREQPLGGEGEQIHVFDGHDLFVFESGGAEYARPKVTIDRDKPLPEPYDAKLDWNKMKEVQRLPCGFSGKDHTCVIFEAPIKPWLRPNTPGDVIRMTDGVIRVMADTETGIWLRVHVSSSIGNDMGASQLEVNYNIKQMSYGAASDMALFKLPEGSQEVNDLTRWNEDRFKKELAGKPAPGLQATDIHGAPVSLADLKGKTVLLDFWTTWCPPCQSDASSLEKLNQKFGNKNLAIVGVSVDEDRATVENYLKKHPHSYPVVLSSENRLSPPYQIRIFPTYLIISPEGTLVTAEQGDQGFARLRKDLERAGMNIE
jgi:thiol-disulfide isomerase/thioredoxin